MQRIVMAALVSIAQYGALADRIAAKHGIDPGHFRRYLANEVPRASSPKKPKAPRVARPPRQQATSTGLSAQTIDRFIAPGSPLAKAGGAQMLLRATGGNLAGAAFLAALARKESSFGAQAFAPNNFWGYGIHLGPDVNTAPTVEAMASRVWKGLSGNLYRGAGLTTPSQIINRYAPPSENNTSLYQQQVNSWFTQMGLSPQTNIFNGSGGRTATDAATASSPVAASIQQGIPALDVNRLAGILNAQRARVLRGEMPTANYTTEVQKLLKGTATKQQVATTAQRVGAGVALAGSQAGKTAGDIAVAAGQAIVAKQIPYSWGGGTPSGPTRGFGRGANTVGFDCSSFAQYMWAKAGVSIPRTTYGQIKVGAAVPSIAQAKPGDLLFPHAGHVQIYIGNGQVIEEPRTGGHAQVAPVRSSYLAIRRPG